MSKYPEVTDRAYLRSHGKSPKGTGGWWFQASSTSYAFDRDLYGDQRAFFGTFTEARKTAREVFANEYPDVTFVAVLP